MKFETPITALTLGGVALLPGQFLHSGAAELSAEKPNGKMGYAYLDGQTLVLHDYVYQGSGAAVSGASIGICVPAGSLQIRMEGDSTITIDAAEKGIGMYVPEDAEVSLVGKGSLALRAQNGESGNCAIFGEGSLELKSGVLRVSAGLAASTQTNGKQIYVSDSYAIDVRTFVDNNARITGNDKRGNRINRNNPQQAVYDFPRVIPWIPLLLCGVTLAAAAVTVWALYFRQPVVLTPDYAPVDAEQYAETIPGEVDTEKMDQPEGGGSISLSYSIDVTVDRSAKEAALYFANPSRSNKDVVVQLVVQDEILAQSGTLKPGNQVQKLELLNGMAKKLAPGGYDGFLRVLSYDQDSGEKTILDTDIAVTVTVQ